jgi:hypothetical protein
VTIGAIVVVGVVRVKHANWAVFALQHLIFE